MIFHRCIRATTIEYKQQPLNFLLLLFIESLQHLRSPLTIERFFFISLTKFPPPFLKNKNSTKRSGKSKVTRERQRPGNAGLPGTSELSTNKVSRFHTMPMHLLIFSLKEAATKTSTNKRGWRQIWKTQNERNPVSKIQPATAYYYIPGRMEEAGEA
jgi:hypothetical protein